MLYLQLSFLKIPQTAQEIIIAALDSIGFEAFHQTDNELFAYIEKALFNEKQLHQTLHNFQQSAFISQYKITALENKNWNTLWESNFPPVIIADQLLIKAPFHNIEKEYPYVIELEPKMAFGTGHHETTSMVLEAMLSIDFSNKTVLDFGCGTAILAIFAAIKNATYIDAIDIDDWAYKNSLQNIEQTEINNIHIQQGSLLLVEDKQYDLILANINKNVIKDTFAQLYQMLKPEGMLIISGILKEDVEEISVLGMPLFKTAPQIQFKGNWSMLVFKVD